MIKTNAGRARTFRASPIRGQMVPRIGSAALLALTLEVAFGAVAPTSLALGVPSTKTPTVKVPTVTVPAVTVPTLTVPATPVTPPISTPTVSTPRLSSASATGGTASHGGSGTGSVAAPVASDFPSSLSGVVQGVAPDVSHSINGSSAPTTQQRAHAAMRARARARRAAAEQRSLRQLVARYRGCLSDLAPRGARVLSLRSGVGRARAHSARQVAQLMGISYSKEQRIEQSAVATLRTDGRNGGCSFESGVTAFRRTLVFASGAFAPFGVSQTAVASSPSSASGSSATVSRSSAGHSGKAQRPKPKRSWFFSGKLGPVSSETALLVVVGLVLLALTALLARFWPLSHAQPPPDEITASRGTVNAQNGHEPAVLVGDGARTSADGS